MGQDPQYDRKALQGRGAGVSLQQEELLVRLMEECAELTQACSKILRWGWYSSSPDRHDGANNKDDFHKEAGDVGVLYDRISKTLR